MRVKRERKPNGVERMERGVRVTLALQAGTVINRQWLMDNCGLSSAQAKRDLDEIERLMPVTRENGCIRLLRAGAQA